MGIETFNKHLFRFIQKSPTPYHAALYMAQQFKEAGFQELSEQDAWHITGGNSYYVTRDDGSIISFTIGKEDSINDGFRILGAHTDSPTLKIKPRPDKTAHSYLQLGAYTVYPQTRFLSARVRQFIDFLSDHFGEEPYWDNWLS